MTVQDMFHGAEGDVFGADGYPADRACSVYGEVPQSCFGGDTYRLGRVCSDEGCFGYRHPIVLLRRDTDESYYRC